jgi:hypothetical protein
VFIAGDDAEAKARVSALIESTTDVGFLPLLIGLAEQKGVVGYPGHGTNLWPALHARDLAEAIGSRLDLPVVSIPADVPMLPGFFGFREFVHAGPPGVQPHHPPDPRLGTSSAQADLDNGHYFPAS